MFGFYRVAAASPKIKVADTIYNTKEICQSIQAAENEHSSLIVFPELSLTGYSCADLFHQAPLLTSSLDHINKVITFSRDKKIIIVVGAPMIYQNNVFNCAFVIQAGQLKGIVPKTYLPNYREFYEKRWFKSGRLIHHDEITVLDQQVSFGTHLLFQVEPDFVFGIEICEDLWNIIPPSSYQTLAGATVCLNLSASNELVSKADYRNALIRQQSARCMSAYIYASAGVHESSTDTVYSGHCLIAENGRMLAENKRFHRDNNIIYADIDCQRLRYTRINEGTFPDNELGPDQHFKLISMQPINQPPTINRFYSPTPFVPADESKRSQYCEEIFDIQTAGLCKRLEHTNCEKAVIGISGGLDSTLALLVVEKAFRLLDKDSKNIVTITMPGFGTTDRTRNNASDLCLKLKTDLRQIDITDACLQHFKDIGHDKEIHDVTYENVQARERTQVLMNIANKERGLVVGTGDLSEIALGWSTYNGDHISMYSVNCGVPKTLIQYLIAWVADHSASKLGKILHDIIDTPISPELLPNTKDAGINQKTEDILGPYELHDFFLYHMVKYGADAEKLEYIANLAFANRFTPELIKTALTTFIRRFFTHQFKRSCIPDGPKVGTISLSPRGDWRMPSDSSANIWLNQH